MLKPPFDGKLPALAFNIYGVCDACKLKLLETTILVLQISITVNKGEDLVSSVGIVYRN